MNHEELVNRLLAIATSIIELASTVGKISEPPAANGAEWIVRRGQRGRAPNWVLDLTGLPDKQTILRKYGSGFKFVRGQTPPSLP